MNERQLSRRGVLVGGAAVGAAGIWTASSWDSGQSTRGWAGGGGASLAITDVDLVDGSSPSPRRDMTVLIVGGRIADVGRASELTPPPDCVVVDGRGKFLIPGLIDMHAHSPESVNVTPSLYVVNGVTSVREMAGTPVLRAWRDAVDRGELLGPAWTIGSEIVDGYPSLLLGPGETAGVIVTRGEAEVPGALRRIRKSHADFVKIYSRVSPEAFQALTVAARRTGLPVAGHVPDAVPLDVAVRSGISTIEHLHAIGCSTSTDAAWARLASMRIAPGDYASWFRQLHPIEFAALTRQVPSRTSRMFDLLAESGTFVDPTLTMHLTVDRPEDVDTADPRLDFVPESAREFWEYGLQEIYLAGRSKREKAEQRRLYELRLELVGNMQSQGVRLLAGTEAGFIYSFPGFGMHDELVQLQRAGLTPWQALVAATKTPAEALDQADEVGAIDAGKLANLVLLDADPLADIANTRKIDSVVLKGRLITPEMRRNLLADAKRAAADPAAMPAAYRAGCGCHMPRQLPAQAPRRPSMGSVGRDRRRA